MQIHEQLKCFESIIGDCAGEDLSQIEADIKRLRSKADDKTLYLAVIGEFSSGKSTFINALLRRKLLKTGVMPTTACAAYIEKSDGPACIDVAFGRNRFKVYGEHYAHLYSYIYKNYQIEIKNLQHLIDLLTSEQAVAKDVTELHLRITDVSLPDNICIIDTPGFDPAGDEASSNHFEITRSTVENWADAAIVIINSHKPFSKSLRSFLSDYVAKYLHRCLFVCNRLDQIGDEDEEDEPEREDIIRFVRSGLKRDFNLPEARVFPCSANSMVNPCSRAICRYWQEEFKNFENIIWPLLGRQKDIILTEHINNLAVELNRRIKRAVEKRAQDLTERQRRLNAGRVEAIEKVTKELTAACKLGVKDLILDFKSRFESRYNRKRVGFFNGLEERIEAADSLESLKSWLLNDLEKELGDFFKDFESYAADKVAAVRGGLEGLLKTVQDGFNAHYAMFPALKYREKEFSIGADIADKLSFSFSSLNRIVEARQGEAFLAQGSRTAGGVITGIVGGLAVGGPIGAVFGAVAGYFAGEKVGGAKAAEILAEAKTELKRSLHGELDKRFSDYKEMYVAGIDSLEADIFFRIEKYGRRHIRSYGEQVKILIERQEEENLRLGENIERLNAHERLLLDIEESNRRELIVLRNRTQ